MIRKILNILFTIFFFALVIFFFRKPILRGLALFLIVEDEVVYVENSVVLSGGAYDRGKKASYLWNENKTKNIICTGANFSSDLAALNIDTTESQITRNMLLNEGVPNTNIILLQKGTSTFEEADAILKYCLKNKIDEVLIISSKFHTRRIHQAFNSKFESNGVNILIVGAPSSTYDEMKWWESEQGLIALNNEYIKLLYYFLKY